MYVCLYINPNTFRPRVDATINFYHRGPKTSNDVHTTTYVFGLDIAAFWFKVAKIFEKTVKRFKILNCSRISFLRQENVEIFMLCGDTQGLFP
jgi:hypothetical protein